MSEKGKKRGKSSGLGLAIWILAFVIVIIVFLVKWDDIKSNLVKTRFFERLFGKTPSFLVDKNSENKKDDDSENVIELTKSDDKSAEKISKKTEPQKSKKEIESQDNQKNEQKISEKKAELQKSEPKITEQKKKSENPQRKSDDSESENKKLSNQIKIVEESNIDTTSRKSESKKSEEKSSEAMKKSEEKKSSENKKTEDKTVVQNEKPATIAAKICFVAIDSEGTVIRKIVSRQVAKDSPLTESLNALLSGPNLTESKTGCQTLIPSGTKLYSAAVKSGTATLDFSEEFEINTNGVQGFLGQLMQIVYTATNFSTVQNVQILIEGEKKEYLGSEGVWIGSPLSRASFR